MSEAEVANLTMCPACKQTYTDPSLLPCRDTLCKKCFFNVETAPSRVDPSQQVRRCPVCHIECQANGSDLRPDIRASWIVRTRQASVERQKRETAKGRCSLPHCGEAAISKGYYFEGTLCASHVRTDEEKFAEIKLTAQSLLELVRGLTKQRKDALADLQTVRADTAQLMDAIEARMQRCKKSTLGRLDIAIDKLKLELRAVDFIEKLQVEIQDAERVGDMLLSSQLFKQLHLSLADVDVNAGWANSADETVELSQHLLTTVGTIAADVETGKGGHIRACLELRDPICQEVYTKGITPLAVTACSYTDGYYCNAETGALTKECRDGVLPLPTRCVVTFGKKEAGYFAAAPNPRELWAQFFDVFGRFTGQFDMELPHGATLVAAECASQVQRFFLLLTNTAPPAATPRASATSKSPSLEVVPMPPPDQLEASTDNNAESDAEAKRDSAAEVASDGGRKSVSSTDRKSLSMATTSARAVASASCPPFSPVEVLVMDLAGAQLQSVRDPQLGGGGPARGLVVCGDYLSTVSIYVLGASGSLACISAGGTCQVQECIQLLDEVKDARSVAASGRRLVLVTPRSVQLMSPVTQAVNKLFTIGDKDAELKRAASLGCGFVGVADASRWQCFPARSGVSLRSYRGCTEPVCIGRMDSGCLRFFYVRSGK